MIYLFCLILKNRFGIDFNFAPRHLTDLVIENPVESQIVQVNSKISFDLFQKNLFRIISQKTTRLS
jgi:hypothetical protein